MSWHPCPTASVPHNIAEDYVNYISRNAIPKAMTIEDVKSATLQDPLMQILIQAIETRQWRNPALKPFQNVKDELSVANGLVLRQNRVVIPSSLQQKSVDLAHATHHGIVKTKQLIREKVWFSAIDRIVEEKLRIAFTAKQLLLGNTHILNPYRCQTSLKVLARMLQSILLAHFHLAIMLRWL